MDKTAKDFFKQILLLIGVIGLRLVGFLLLVSGIVSFYKACKSVESMIIWKMALDLLKIFIGSIFGLKELKWAKQIFSTILKIDD